MEKKIHLLPPPPPPKKTLRSADIYLRLSLVYLNSKPGHHVGHFAINFSVFYHNRHFIYEFELIYFVGFFF